MVARHLIVQRSEEAERETAEVLKGLGALDGEDIEHLTGAPNKAPLASHARLVELIRALTRAVAEQRVVIDGLEQRLSEKGEAKSPAKKKASKPH